MLRGKLLFVVLLEAILNASNCQKMPGGQVSTMVTKYMTPVITAKGNLSYESHASNIEQLQLVASEGAVKGYVKHPNVSFAVQITRKSCKAIKLCFGNRSNLFRHLDILSKVKFGEKGYNRKISHKVFELVERSVYEVDACSGMTAIEWEFPASWAWSNTSQQKGFIHYSTLYKAGVPSTYRSKMTGISNVETIILHNDLSSVPQKLGLEIRHGPVMFDKPLDQTAPAHTTFYETFDLWSHSKALYFVLAQDANSCGARFSAPLTTHTFMKRDIIFNFRPGIVYRVRKGVNIWSIPLGFIVGTCVGVVGASFLLCVNSKKFYKRWNKQMKKTYGKFATADTTTVGGISQMTTVGGGLSKMTGISQMGNTTTEIVSNIGGTNPFY
ncbi:unnamed protein product [Litomosoides sigmodontis]|uniref:Peptidase A1 domain-containing protein n=1 Tax=Litomosoides sigmodontis TaxID=42156 RepID=A0A3P6TX88_LITSI|nr:unnamed protein product [Litomosoides sigmodontis]